VSADFLPIYSSLFTTVVVEKATITDKQDGEKRNNMFWDKETPKI